MQILNVAFLRILRRLRRIRVAPYTWTISCPAESWFDVHRRFFTARWDNSSSFYIDRLCTWFQTCDLTPCNFFPHFRASFLSSRDVLPIGLLEPFALLAAICRIDFVFFCRTFSWPGAGRAIALTYHTCRTIWLIKQNSAESRLRSKIGPANVGWKWKVHWVIWTPDRTSLVADHIVLSNSRTTFWTDGSLGSLETITLRTCTI